MKTTRTFLTCAVALAGAVASAEMPAGFQDWPSGLDPQTVGRRVIAQFQSTLPEAYAPKGFSLDHPYGGGKYVCYSVASLWVNALEFARKTGDAALEKSLCAALEPFLPGGAKADKVTKPRHVDFNVFGAVPLEVGVLTGRKDFLKMGLRYADDQWESPRADDLADYPNWLKPHYTPVEKQQEYLRQGYSGQTRLWIDDMYMINLLQTQAFRATKDRKYILRAAHEMCLYLDKLQLEDGLFNHAADVPFRWSRGNGWMAAGLPIVLGYLTPADADYARILAGYRKMMATLLKCQRPSGLWGQLVDDSQSWDETSGSLMFAYGFIRGCKHGWLDEKTYAPAARKAYLAVASSLDAYGNVPNVCCGTGAENSRDYYYKRDRINGDPHGQAPLLWCCAELVDAPYAPETAPREVRFANPPASARILPIHHHRSNDLARADAEIKALVAEGFGGTAGNVSFKDYLESPEAWKTYRYFLERSHALGLVHWLYDEKGYPSGTAGGKTLEGHPEWQARAYLVAVTNVPAGSAVLPPSPPGRKVATIRRRSADGATDAVYVITDDYIREGTHVSASVSKYKYAYPNLLMAEPTARFIELTHDAYAKNLGDSLKFVTSTFTDEPSLMTWWLRPMPYLCLPVSDELLAAYARAAGHALADDVPSLVGGSPTGEVAAVRHRFWTMVGERVAHNFTGQITKWCDARGIESGGHLLCEEGLVSHVCLYGDFFKVLRGLSAPSCDVLTSIPSKVPWLTPLLIGSAGDLNGARHRMSEASSHCECYRPEGDKRPVYVVNEREIVGSLNRQIWGGVNTFTSYYRWTGITTEQKRRINEEIGRTQTLVGEGSNAAEIALLYPADSLMVGFEPQKLHDGGALARRTAGLVKSVGDALFAANRAFMFVDSDSLVAAKVGHGELAKGALRWRTVVLAGVTTLPVEVARQLEKFRQAGGFVLAVGVRPCNSATEFPSVEIARLASGWTFLADEKPSRVADVVRAHHEPTLACVRGKAGVLATSHRRTAEGDVFFVMNTGADAWTGAVRLADGGAATIWNPRTGLTVPATGDIALDLPSYGAVVLTTERPVSGRLVP